MTDQIAHHVDGFYALQSQGYMQWRAAARIANIWVESALEQLGGQCLGAQCGGEMQGGFTLRIGLERIAAPGKPLLRELQQW